jgi:hypothetical protein
MNHSFVKRCFRIDRANIAYLRFILEGYDGLVFLRTLDPRAALVEVAYPASCRVDAESLLAALVAECAMSEAPWPPLGHYPSL